jgi:O-methyltransferase
MIGLRRLRHLRVVAEEALARGVRGDFVETGVWRGGACILLAGVLHAHGVADRRVVVADSFAGLPPPDPRYDKDALSAFDFHLRPELAVGLDEVRGNFERYGLLDERVMFLEGFFRDTLPAYPQRDIAILRMDGDLYSSTMDALTHLYPKVVPGGWVICDDYGVVIDARRAVIDFRAARGISTPMLAVDGDAVFWRKEG